MLPLLLTLLLSGCYARYSVSSPELVKCEYTDGGGEIVEHLFVENSGWYLFYYLPICCGDDNPRNVFPLEIFNDRCTPEIVRQRFDERVKELGPDVEAKGVAFVNEESVTFDVPGFSFPLVIPYLLCTRDVQISGTIVRKGISK